MKLPVTSSQQTGHVGAHFDHYQLILASSSPRRQELLKLFQVPFKIMVPDIHESSIADFSIPGRATTLAMLKAQKIQAQFLSLESSTEHAQDLPPYILASDTIVVCEKKILEKPASLLEAQEMLQFLSGKVHQVYTAVVCLYPILGIKTWQQHTLLGASQVEFYPLSSQLLKQYLATQDSLDKAGAYGLQGMAQLFIKKLEGTYASVVGLPVDLIAKLWHETLVASDRNWKDVFI